ncbi:acyl-CoA-binding domain-containing protein 5-B isoform X1 [Pimephales promelas]|uniref:acyl-CoA-binding domain-containing protein 5-B isoform X1 n=3 Tax=Pimephales promelas TaxID=90988 RepID=UPI001955A04C|nr:acyl-CoA-binding domain-containing protein 5-B isoform X1 [Pimephales promelas]
MAKDLSMRRSTMEEDPKSIQRRFEAAVKVIRNLPEDGSYDLSDDMLVMLYSYYKQATAGPCNTLKPNSWDPIGKAKWEAWKALGNISKDQAMMEYVQEIQLIIETLPVTDRMAELMDALDPFYEMVEDDDDDPTSKASLLSTVSSTHAAERGSLPVFNESEENSVSSSTNDTHSSLNTEEEDEELAYDESDGEIYSGSMEKPATPEKGSGVPRVHLAEVNVVGANMQQGGNREPQCESQDGKPQGIIPPVPHPPTLGTVQTDRISPGRGRGRGLQLMGTSLPDKHECGFQGNGQRWETFNTEIAVILSQLQDNMQDVLGRLTTLEHLTASQAEITSLKTLNCKASKKRWSWWTLNSPHFAAVLTVIWPFAVHWLVQFYLLKRRRWLRVK